MKLKFRCPSAASQGDAYTSVLATLTAVGATIDPQHVFTTGGVKTVFMKNLNSVSKISSSNIRIDAKAMQKTAVLEVDVNGEPTSTEDRGWHVDMKLSGSKAGVAVQKYVDALDLLSEESMTFPGSMLTKWPGLQQKYKTIGSAELVWHTPIDDLTVTGLEDPLTRPVHDFV